MRLLSGIITAILAGVIWMMPVYSGPRKVVWEEINFKVIKTEHFYIFYPQDNVVLGKMAAIYAEEASLYISEKLGHHLSAPVSIIVYPSHNHFQATHVIPYNLGEGTGGFTESIRTRVVVPFMGSWKEFRHVITHEIVHAFQYDILFGETYGGSFALPYRSQPPLWVMEGFAEYLSVGWDETAESTVREAVLTGTLPSVMDLTSYRVQNGYMYYKAGQAILWYIDMEYGSVKLGELLKDVRDQRSLEDTIRVNFGMSIEEFNERWNVWLRRKYFRDIHHKTAMDTGRLITDHRSEPGFVHFHPAISPDGKKAAFLTIRDFYPAIVLRDIPEENRKDSFSPEKSRKKPREKILIHGGNNAEFYGLHILDNRLSFSGDGQILAFTATTKGRDVIYLLRIKDKKIIKKIIPPVESISRPYMTRNGAYVVFSGTLAGQNDIYLADVKSGKVKQITNDAFADETPVLSEDGTFLLFSSNRNAEGKTDSSDFNLFRIKLDGAEPIGPEAVLSLKGNQNHPVFFYPGKHNRILFISDHEGIPNIYMKDMDDPEVYRVTDYASGVSGISMDDKARRIVTNYYHYQSYDILLHPAPREEDDVVSTTDADYEKNTFLLSPVFPHFPGGPQSFEIQEYKADFLPDWFFFGLQYSNYYGLGGFFQSSFTDNLGNQKVSLYLDFLSQRESINFTLDYVYLKKRIDFHVGAFKASNYYSIFNFADLASINNLFYNPNFLSYYINRFGFYAQADYPVDPFLTFSLQWEFSRYEEMFYPLVPEDYLREDIFTNIHALNLGMAYNNVLYSYMGPLSGTHVQLISEQSMNFTGHDYVYHRDSLDVRHYWLFWERFVYAFRFYAGSINGPEAEYFPFQIGGYNSIRSFAFLSLSGRHTLLMKNEIRFPFLDALVMGFPTRWFFPGFSGVFFIDMGTAFNDYRHWDLYDPDDRSLKDLKVSYGLGGRLVLLPGLIIKIDWGTPYDLRRSLRMSRWQGVFSIGYEY